MNFAMAKYDFFLTGKPRKIHGQISRSAHRTPNSNFPNLRCCKMFFLFNMYTELYWHFWVHFDINLKLLCGNNIQKVNKQNIGIIDIGCSMS